MQSTLCVKPIQNKSDAQYLRWIMEGIKKYEGRLKTKISETEWGLFIGKEIKFFDMDYPDRWVIIKVSELLIFSNFGEAFDALGEKLIPYRTKNEVIDMYNKLFHYPDESLDILSENHMSSKMIMDNGVVAIGLSIISMKV